MAKYTDEDLKKFAQVYVETKNAAEAARIIGVSEGSSKQRGSDFLKRPSVQKYISQLSVLQEGELTDAVGSMENILEAYSSGALSLLAKEAQIDTSSAKQFLELKLKIEAKNKEKLGEFSGYSTKQLLGEVDNLISQLQETRARVVEAIRTGEMSE